MASMMASCEYMLMGVLYWAWTMVAFPPGPFTSMGLWVERAESFRAMGLKLGVYSTLWVRGQRSAQRGFRCLECRMSDWVQRKHQKLGQRVTAGRLVALSEFEARHTSHTAMRHFPMEFTTTPVRLHKITTFYCLNPTQPVDFFWFVIPKKHILKLRRFIRTKHTPTQTRTQNLCHMHHTAGKTCKQQD